jgi:rhodanese-related sulfurtransferase
MLRAPVLLWWITTFVAVATLAGCGEPAAELPVTSAGDAVPAAEASATEAPGQVTAEVTATAGPGGAITGRLEGGYVHIGPEELAAMLSNKDLFLVNTHAPYGYEIEGTDASIPVDEGGRWLSYYPTDHGAKIVLYCRSGQWSTVAARALVDAGYENVWHLDGGMVAWDRAGLPLVRP